MQSWWQYGQQGVTGNPNPNFFFVLIARDRPLPNSPQPPFQSEAKCEVCYENQFSFILKLELITITKISHLDSKKLERETKGNSEMAYNSSLPGRLRSLKQHWFRTIKEQSWTPSSNNSPSDRDDLMDSGLEFSFFFSQSEFKCNVTFIQMLTIRNKLRNISNDKWNPLYFRCTRVL